MAFCVVADKNDVGQYRQKARFKNGVCDFHYLLNNILILRLWATTFAILRVIIEHPIEITSLILMT
jgi:hypothetical protein